MQARDLIFPLNKAQYVSVSEGYLSALAWNCFASLPKEADKKVALRYRPDLLPTSKGLIYRATEPSTSEEISALGALLEQRGLATDGQSDLLAKAVAVSIRGVKTDSGKFQPASPLSPMLALLQNNEGIHGSENPPPVAGILETMFRLGDVVQDGKGAAELWLESSMHRLNRDPLLSAVDDAIGSLRFGQRPAATNQPQFPSEAEATWAALLRNSPFSWFAESWRSITSENWVEALPARVWTDWATTILRTAYGLGVLWECAWYESLARSVIGEERLEPEEILRNMDPILPWRSGSDSAEIRDLSSKIKVRCQRAQEISNSLEAWLAQESSEDIEASQAIAKMSADQALRDALARDLQPKRDPKIGKGRREAIRYALKVRESNSSNSDHYGLLRTVGSRYLFPDPALEWITVMASLACTSPGGVCSLGEVKTRLANAGLHPDLEDLVTLLERSGLARGSADADEGLQVASAY